MKKAIVVFIIGMLCVSMSGAVSAIGIQKTDYKEKNIVSHSHISTEESTAKLAKTADKYLNLNEDYFEPCLRTIENNFNIPWINSLRTSLFEWWINVKYDGTEQSQKIDIDPDEFDKFLKNPLYMREYYFNVDPDDDDDVQVKIGFYKATVLNMQTGTDTKALATKTIIRTWFPDGSGIEDTDKDLQVWSEIRLNYGLFKSTAKNKSPYVRNPLSSIKDARPGFLFRKIMEGILEQRENKAFTPLINLLGRIKNNLQENKNNHEVLNEMDIAPLVSDDDWVSIGMGYHSTEGNRIPQVVEKHFTFAKNNIFSPSIFQHEMFPGGEDPYQLEFGFRACAAGTVDPENAVYDIGFGVEFEPAVYMRTQFIPIGGYVYYHFGQGSQSSQTRVTFLADIVKGEGDDVPLLSLFFDRIDSTLGRSGSWISFDLNLNGFEYKASSGFDVGINVGVPDKFDEKVQIKGLPTNVKFDWGVTNTDLIIIPDTRFQFGLDVEANLVMNGRIDKIIVYYPRIGDYPEDAPDAPFLEVTGIAASNTITAGGSIDIISGSMLNVDVSGNVGLTMSGRIDGISVYYPKADWYDTADIEFIALPEGLPGRVLANAYVKLKVDLNNLMNPSNYIYGKVSHDFSDKIDAINVMLPGFEDPIVSFTEIPAYGELRGELYWAKLQGYAYSYRNSNGRPPDPVTINFEYDLDGDGMNDFKLYNKLKIRDGHIYTSFNIANRGHFYFDTSNKMLENDFRFYNYKSGDSILISVDEVSANQLQADWDIDTSGEKIQINSLNFGGIIDTLKGLDLSLDYKGKTASLDLDWVIGEQGNFAIELNQDNDITLDFDELFPQGEGYVLDGGITLTNNFNFDMEWKLDLGESAQNPGYFRINKYNDNTNIKNFDLYFTLKDSSGEEAYGIDIKFVNPKIYLDLEWYFDIDDIWPPYIFYWLDVDFQADYKDVKLLWTDLWQGSDRYGEHYWIEVI